MSASKKLKILSELKIISDLLRYYRTASRPLSALLLLNYAVGGLLTRIAFPTSYRRGFLKRKVRHSVIS
jgi:hypothetical protein